jgi:bis(5'-nucleosidyl)-tetraphosphatase
MNIERSAGAVVFRKENSRILYLLLRYSTESVEPFWDLPKGHIEKGENELGTAMREVEEETGLGDIKFLTGFKKRIRYSFQLGGQFRSKIVTFYLAETQNEDAKISPEHVGYIWSPYKQALAKLTFDGSKETKEIIKKAHQFLKLRT